LIKNIRIQENLQKSQLNEDKALNLDIYIFTINTLFSTYFFKLEKVSLKTTSKTRNFVIFSKISQNMNIITLLHAFVVNGVYDEEYSDSN
jgi:hypothetical protein